MQAFPVASVLKVRACGAEGSKASPPASRPRANRGGTFCRHGTQRPKQQQKALRGSDSSATLAGRGTHRTDPSPFKSIALPSRNPSADPLRPAQPRRLVLDDEHEFRDDFPQGTPAWEVGKVNLNAATLVSNRAGFSQAKERLLRSHQASTSSPSSPHWQSVRQPGHRTAHSRPSSLEQASLRRERIHLDAATSQLSLPQLQVDPLPAFVKSLDPSLLPPHDHTASLSPRSSYQLHSLPQESKQVLQSESKQSRGTGTRSWLQGLWRKLTGSVDAAVTDAESGAAAEGQATGECFRLKLTCLQSTVLLNVLAFGYAATAVVVKAMEGGAGEAQAATMGLSEAAASVAAATEGGGCFSVTTSIEFAVRFAAAAVASTVLMRLTRPQGNPEEVHLAGANSTEGRGGSSAWVAGVDLGLWMFVTYAAQAVGLQTTSAHDAALILTASVVLVPLLEAMEGSKLHWSVWVATALACSGLLLLEGGSAEAATQVAELAVQGVLVSPLQQLGIPAGHLWCFLGAVGSAVHVVRSEKHCVLHGPLELVNLQLGTTAVLGAMWLGFNLMNSSVGAGDGALSMPAFFGNACAALPLGMLLLAGPLGTGLCEWLELEALQYVKASTATLILTASPLWASLLAFLTLGETITTTTLLGGGLILAASLQVQLLAPCREEA